MDSSNHSNVDMYIKIHFFKLDFIIESNQAQFYFFSQNITGSARYTKYKSKKKKPKSTNKTNNV